MIWLCVSGVDHRRCVCGARAQGRVVEGMTRQAFESACAATSVEVMAGGANANCGLSSHAAVKLFSQRCQLANILLFYYCMAIGACACIVDS